MAEFDHAIKTVLKHEGRYSDNDNDPGGATNFGISLRFLKNSGDIDKDGWPDGDINFDRSIDVEDIKTLTEKRATYIYRLYFWNKNYYSEINEQAIATKIFDLAVNMGSYAAHKIAQRACRAAIGHELKEDGILGARSFSIINFCNPDILMAAIKSEAAGYYRSIKYKGSESFLAGWLNRAYSSPVSE